MHKGHPSRDAHLSAKHAGVLDKPAPETQDGSFSGAPSNLCTPQEGLALAAWGAGCPARNAAREASKLKYPSSSPVPLRGTCPVHLPDRPTPRDSSTSKVNESGFQYRARGWGWGTAGGEGMGRRKDASRSQQRPSTCKGEAAPPRPHRDPGCDRGGPRGAPQSRPLQLPAPVPQPQVRLPRERQPSGDERAPQVPPSQERSFGRKLPRGPGQTLRTPPGAGRGVGSSAARGARGRGGGQRGAPPRAAAWLERGAARALWAPARRSRRPRRARAAPPPPLLALAAPRAALLLAAFAGASPSYFPALPLLAIRPPPPVRVCPRAPGPPHSWSRK